MKIAIVFENNQVSQHYGQSQGFKIFDLDDKKNIISSETIFNSGIKGCEMASLFASYDVDTVIVGGIGENAKRNLEEHDMNVILGAYGEVSKVIDDYCHHTLKLNDVKPRKHHNHENYRKH